MSEINPNRLESEVCATFSSCSIQPAANPTNSPPASATSTSPLLSALVNIQRVWASAICSPGSASRAALARSFAVLRLPSPSWADQKVRPGERPRIARPSSSRLSNTLGKPKKAAHQMIRRDASRTPGHDAERHRRPREMDRPAVGNGELDNQRHEQQSQRGKARP